MKLISKSMLAIALMVIIAKPVLAQNDQTFVIGHSLGIHAYSQIDDIRRTLDFFDKIGIFNQLWGEWYLQDRLGIGFKIMWISAYEKGGGSVTANTSGGTMNTNLTTKSQLFITTPLATVQYLPFISSDAYTRVGVYGGVGYSTYDYTQTTTGGGISSSYKASSSGPATNFGAFIDWGGEDFGVRLGYGYLKTTLSDITYDIGPKQSVDATGSHLYFDLRGAFN